MSSSSLADIMVARVDAGVQFVLVGGLAAVAQGAPLTTFDVDIVHRRTEPNIDALLAVLTRLNAYYRGRPGGQRLPPDRRALSGPGHSLFMTDLGPLDVLGELENHRSHDDLVESSVVITLEGRPVSVLSLQTLVELIANVHAPQGSTSPPDPRSNAAAQDQARLMTILARPCRWRPGRFCQDYAFAF